MKKTHIYALLAGLCILLFVPFATGHAEDEWTLMIYLCGSDLETDQGSGSLDLLEMMEAGIEGGAGVNVLIETGGAQEWWLKGIDPDLNQRWALDGEQILLLEERSREDMGNPDTLYGFLDFSMQYFPAKRYGLILWDHGSGATGGVCYDEFTGNALHMSDVYAAINIAEQEHGFEKLDFVGFDACLMAGFETASYLSHFADYMIASEELEPGSGWDYANWLSIFASAPEASTVDLLSHAVDCFVETCLQLDPDDLVTLSVIDLAYIEDVSAALEGMGQGLNVALEQGEFQSISRYRQSMRSFGEYYSAASDMVDMGHFAEVYAEVSGGADQLLAALEDAVAYSRHSDNLENVSGLSVLLPFSTRSSADEYLPAYDGLSMAPNYTAFITDWTEMLNGGSHSFQTAQPQLLEGEELSSQAGWIGAFLQGAPESGSEEEESAFQDGLLAYMLPLDVADIEYLSHVEGNLMMDVSDEELECYVDLGYLRDVHIDWKDGVVYSLFDGTWPVLEGQLVNMSDQIITENTRRSVIDVTINDEEVYLLVIFDDARPTGEVVGYTEGYNENGLPVRGYEKLKEGDIIVPMYDLLYWDEDGEMQSERFAGDPIEYTGAALSFGYEDISGDETDYVYAFCLNDIFGEYTFSDFVGLTL